MKRDTLITVLLVIAGIVLAFVLFGAGALWKGKDAKKSSQLKFGTNTEFYVSQLRLNIFNRIYVPMNGSSIPPHSATFSKIRPVRRLPTQ